jgi:site-specific recombinase XerC
MLFDWLVVGQVLAINPAHAVRGPKHVVARGKTPVLTEEEARRLLESIDTSTLVGLRDRALIGVMTYAVTRISAFVERVSPGNHTVSE